MDSFFSRPLESAAEPDLLPTTETRPVPYQAASLAPDDMKGWYADFWGKAYCVPHSDGRHVIIGAPGRERGVARDPVEEQGWATKKLRKVYERLGDDECDRIVRFGGVLEDGSVLVERPGVGPQEHLTLPRLKVPVVENEEVHVAAGPRENRIMLALYYRWALQALSALSFLHSHGVHAKFSSSQNVWLRADFSLVTTGFISAIVDGEEDDYGEEGGWAGDEWIMYGGGDAAEEVAQVIRRLACKSRARSRLEERSERRGPGRA